MVVVDAGGQRFLLGVTDHAVNVLHTGDIPEDTEEAADALASLPRRGGAAGAFAQILASAGGTPAAASSAASRAGADSSAAPATTAAAEAGASELPLSRRSSIHRESHARTAPGRGTVPPAAHPPLHGSILAGSTWKQAAAALRSGRRN